MVMTEQREVLLELATVTESAAESPLEWSRDAVAWHVLDNETRQPLDLRVGAPADSTSADLAPPAPNARPFPGQPPHDGGPKPLDLGTVAESQRSAIPVSTLNLVSMHETFQDCHESHTLQAFLVAVHITHVDESCSEPAIESPPPWTSASQSVQCLRLK